MSSSTFKTTACPMDCFDACQIQYKDNRCKPSRENKITNGSLCKPFAYLSKEANIKDKNVQNTLEKIANVLKQKNKKILYYKGTGNVCAMQNTPKIFFEKIKATITKGSICEEAGIAGLCWGKGYCVNPNIEELISSEVIVVWGRNLTTTSRHIYKLIKDKVFITIDPYKTKIAHQSEEYFKIPVKGDYQLLVQLNKALNNSPLDEEMLKKLNTSKEQIENTLSLLKGKKVSFLLGLGAQKYKEGAQIIHEIDKFANKFGVNDGINKGVWYLGDSQYVFDSKIQVEVTNSVAYPSVDFADYDVVFIQGANPAVSAPHTSKVIAGLSKTFVIFMGTTYNDTAHYADIILPAKTFLQKKDVRLSYGHDEVVFTDVCEETKEAVSEYEFTRFMFDSFEIEGLLSEEEYLNAFKVRARNKPKVDFIEHEVPNIPLLDLKKDEFYMLSSKHEDTLNSQFKYNNYVYVNPDISYTQGDEVLIKSIYGEVKAQIKTDANVQKNSILFYAGNKLANYLSPDGYSDMGFNAIFQEVKLTLRRV